MSAPSDGKSDQKPAASNDPGTLDPESFRGKLYLLIFDKLVIGALIAVAFVGYDGWKTAETQKYNQRIDAEIQHHDDARDALERSFKSAEYVRDLVPVVTDPSKDPMTRAEDLAALIRTRSIDDESAFQMAENVLSAGLLQEDRHVPGWTSDHFLLDALLTRMPDAFEIFLDRYDAHEEGNFFPDTPPNQPPPELRAKMRNFVMVSRFWQLLLIKTIAKSGDRMPQLDNDNYLRQNLGSLIDIVIPPDRLAGAAQWPASSQDVETWNFRKTKGTKILWSLIVLHRSAQPQLIRQAAEIAAGILDKDHKSKFEEYVANLIWSDVTDFSQEGTGQREGPAERVQQICSIIFKEKGLASKPGNDCLFWASWWNFPFFWSPAEKPLNSYLSYLQQTPSSELSDSPHWEIDLLADIISARKSPSATYRGEPKAQAERLLAAFLALPRDKLDRSGLTKMLNRAKETGYLPK